MGRTTLIAGATAVSLLVSGCAHDGSDDAAGALLIGAAVIGLGLLAVGASDSDDDSYASPDYRHRGRNHQYREYNRYAGNGRCDDPSYNTSNGGHAARGTDERDCRRYGQGRK